MAKGREKNRSDLKSYRYSGWKHELKGTMDWPPTATTRYYIEVHKGDNKNVLGIGTA